MSINVFHTISASISTILDHINTQRIRSRSVVPHGRRRARPEEPSRNFGCVLFFSSNGSECEACEQDSDSA